MEVFQSHRKNIKGNDELAEFMSTLTLVLLLSFVLCADCDANKFGSHVIEVGPLQSEPVNEPLLSKVNTSTQETMKEKRKGERQEEQKNKRKKQRKKRRNWKRKKERRKRTQKEKKRKKKEREKERKKEKRKEWGEERKNEE